MEFNKGNSSRLDQLRTSGQDGERRAAVVARRLNTIAKEIDIPGTEAARSSIEKYCENFEASLLATFDSVYEPDAEKPVEEKETMNVKVFVEITLFSNIY